MTPTKTKTTTKKVKLPPNPFIHEVFELACKQRSKAKKVEILQEYRDDSITDVLILNFDETVHKPAKLYMLTCVSSKITLFGSKNVNLGSNTFMVSKFWVADA